MSEAAAVGAPRRRTPGQRVPEFAGNTCEPWLARYAVVFLDRLLDSGARQLLGLYILGLSFEKRRNALSGIQRNAKPPHCTNPAPCSARSCE